MKAGYRSLKRESMVVDGERVDTIYSERTLQLVVAETGAEELVLGGMLQCARTVRSDYSENC